MKRIKNFIKKIILGLYEKIQIILIRISIALYNTEVDILKADPNDLKEKDKKIQRKLHRNQILEKFYAGQRDEKYVQDYYEILKKADSFLKNSTSHKIASTADKYLRLDGNIVLNNQVYENKDEFGRRYSHFGFFDSKHKHAGKTLGEVLNIEIKERRTTDDDYELLYIFNNKPIELGLNDLFDIVVEKNEYYELQDSLNIAKKFKFPIKVYRNNDNVINKIEEITEYLHVKKIGFEYRQLEFFIPLHYKINEVADNSDIYNELISINQVFVKNQYGEMMGFTINNFIKRITYNNTHEVWKFYGIEMTNVP